MWNKQQILNLKEKADVFNTDDYVLEHLTLLNFHQKNWERLLLIHKRNEEWKHVEQEANHIRARIFQIGEKAA